MFSPNATITSCLKPALATTCSSLAACSFGRAWYDFDLVMQRLDALAQLLLRSLDGLDVVLHGAQALALFGEAVLEAVEFAQDLPQRLVHLRVHSACEVESFP